MEKILYLDPFSGIAGDMFLGLLVDLGVDPEELKKRLSKLGVEFELRIRKIGRAHV